MRPTPKALLLFAGLLLVLGGCAGGPINVRSVTTSEVTESRGRPISAEACGFQLFMVIPISINSRLERAFAQLQRQAAGDKIANLTIEEYWRYAFVGTTHCTKLDAMVYRAADSK